MEHKVCEESKIEIENLFKLLVKNLQMMKIKLKWEEKEKEENNNMHSG
jgi:hypothetical protein